MADAMDRATPDLKVDSKEQARFASFYRSLTEDPDAMVFRIFERKEYYSAHGASAEPIARNYFSTTSVIKHTNSVPYITFSINKYNAIIRDLLLVRGENVEVFAADGGGWKLAKRGSPGNLTEFEDELGQDIREAATVLALKLGGTQEVPVVGVAFADSVGTQLLTSEFQDDDRFSNLESLLVQNGVKEVLLEKSSLANFAKLDDVFERVHVKVTEKQKRSFTAANVEQDLRRLLGDSAAKGAPQLEQRVALPALACLLEYLDLLGDESNYGTFKMSEYQLAEFMRVDAAAIRALNIFALPGDPKNACLFGLLNKTKTPMGSRTMNRWLRQPLLDLEAIGKRHDIVEAFVEDTELRSGLADKLRKTPDLRRYVKKFRRGQGVLQDLIALYDLLVRMPDVLDDLKAYEGEHAALLAAEFTQPLEAQSGAARQYVNMVETTVDLDELAQNRYCVNARFDEDLADLKQVKDEVHEKIARHHDDVCKKLASIKTKGASGVKLEERDDNIHKGFNFVVTQANEVKIRGKKEYEVIQAKKSGAYFLTPELRTFSKEYYAAHSAYLESQEDIVSKAMEVAATFTPVFEELELVLAKMDVLLSFATATVDAPTPYTRPIMRPMGEGVVELRASRHPCVEVVQDDKPFIANDVSLGRTAEAGLLHLITGPNMGGKSTYIRQVGVALLMAQAGCFVPADEATLTVVDNILCRVGAGDSQLRGVSTFMSEMLETAAILRTATKDSFVIIDELGRGTSTYDGFGLAWAISEHLATKTRAACLFATHFHELTELADQQESVKNRHVAAHIENGQLTFLYKVENGACDQSFGIHVAEMAAFPAEVVSMAKRKARELEDFGMPAGGVQTPKQDAEATAVVDQKISTYLRDFAAIEYDGDGGSAVQEGVKRLKTQLEAEDNAILRNLMTELATVA
jgi:DNA mismatch repair protein MSH2